MRKFENWFKSNKAMIYRKMSLFGINSRLKENRVIRVGTFRNDNKGEFGWWFETEGDYRGRVVMGNSFRFEYKGQNFVH